MIIDLSHYIEEGMPIFPGTEPPEIKVAASYEQFGYKESRIQILSHVGTHLDCPAHIYPDGLSVTSMPIDQFYGSGIVIDCSELGSHTLIDTCFINRFNKGIANKDFILFYTAWDRKWGSPAYFEAYPSFTEEAIKYLARMQIKGIGIDAVSIDPIGARQLNNHRIFLQGQKSVIENLHDIDKLIGKEFELMCFPLKLKEGDGSPIRAVAVL